MIELRADVLLKNNLEKIKNKNVLVRVDFNVDFQNGKIFDTYRILAVKQTLKFLNSAKQIVLISHLGDEEKNSFRKLVPAISQILKIKIGFLANLNSKPKEKFSLLENLRQWQEEKECDFNFAKKLSSLGEVFVFEAFSVAHRKHTSVYLLPKILPTFYGFNFEKEIKLLNKVLKVKNLTLILGGAKISTKLPLIERFLNRANLIFLGGGLANTFLKAKGFEMGNSLIENESLKKVKKIYSSKVLTPFDFYVLNKNKVYHRYLGDIHKEDKILDVGEESLNILFEEIKKAKNIVVNGPLGFVEDKRFEKGTLLLVKFLANLKNKFILFGGGDTLSFLTKERVLNKFNISTGGGAMLYYLANEKLWSIK